MSYQFPAFSAYRAPVTNYSYPASSYGFGAVPSYSYSPASTSAYSSFPMYNTMAAPSAVPTATTPFGLRAIEAPPAQKATTSSPPPTFATTTMAPQQSYYSGGFSSFPSFFPSQQHPQFASFPASYQPSFPSYQASSSSFGQIASSAPAPSKPFEIGYWHIRGLAAALRMMCEFAHVAYESKTYKVTGEAGNWDRSAWFDVKPAFLQKNALMNLPYIVDGDVVVTQSNACLTYLGRKFGLNGKNETEVTKMEQCLSQAMDLRNDAIQLFYSSEDKFSDKADVYINNTLPSHLAKFENWSKQNGTLFCASNSPTTADFHLFELLDQHQALARFLGVPPFLSTYPSLQAYYERFGALQEISKYQEGPHHQLPINNVMAVFK